MKKKELRQISFHEDNGIVRDSGDKIIDAYNPVKMRKRGRETIKMEEVTRREEITIGDRD